MSQADSEHWLTLGGTVMAGSLMFLVTVLLLSLGGIALIALGRWLWEMVRK